MNIDANRVIQKLSAQVAAQAQQIAILQVQLEQLQEQVENHEKAQEAKAKLEALHKAE